MHFEPFERDCLKQLYPLVPSPRAAKRLVNVYRLIRAGIPEAAREEFIGDETRGSHRRRCANASSGCATWVADDEPCSTVAGWAPEVARFSFYSGRVFAPVVQREGDSESSVNSESST